MVIPTLASPIDILARATRTTVTLFDSAAFDDDLRQIVLSAADDDTDELRAWLRDNVDRVKDPVRNEFLDDAAILALAEGDLAAHVAVALTAFYEPETSRTLGIELRDAARWISAVGLDEDDVARLLVGESLEAGSGRIAMPDGSTVSMVEPARIEASLLSAQAALDMFDRNQIPADALQPKHARGTEAVRQLLAGLVELLEDAQEAGVGLLTFCKNK